MAENKDEIKCTSVFWWFFSLFSFKICISFGGLWVLLGSYKIKAQLKEYFSINILKKMCTIWVIIQWKLFVIIFKSDWFGFFLLLVELRHRWKSGFGLAEGELLRHCDFWGNFHFLVVLTCFRSQQGK